MIVDYGFYSTFLLEKWFSRTYVVQPQRYGDLNVAPCPDCWILIPIFSGVFLTLLCLSCCLRSVYFWCFPELFSQLLFCKGCWQDAGKHPSRTALSLIIVMKSQMIFWEMRDAGNPLFLSLVLTRQLSPGSVYYFPCNRYIHMSALIQRLRCLSCFVRGSSYAVPAKCVCMATFLVIHELNLDIALIFC